MNNILFEKKPSIKYQANPEAQSRFNTIVDNIDTVKLRYNNNELARRANIANAVCELSPDYKGMFEISPDAAFASFFGLEDSKSIDTMESVLKRVRQHTKDSQNALAEFKKLSRDEQDRIVKEHSPNAKKKEVRAGIYGIPSVAEVDNPEYDSEKERYKHRQSKANRTALKQRSPEGTRPGEWRKQHLSHAVAQLGIMEHLRVIFRIVRRRDNHTAEKEK